MKHLIGLGIESRSINLGLYRLHYPCKTEIENEVMRAKLDKKIIC